MSRSFGLTFRNSFLSGTVFHDGSSCLYFENEELQFADFTKKHSLTKDEIEQVKNKINELINKK